VINVNAQNISKADLGWKCNCDEYIHWCNDLVRTTVGDTIIRNSADEDGSCKANVFLIPGNEKKGTCH
jgi:hypothetical protein